MILKSVGNCIIDFIVSLYTIKIKNRLDYYSGTFYNHWIKRQLGKFGEGSYIGRNCQIQGWGGQSIFVGKNTIIGRHCILGCWKNHNGKKYTPIIQIGDDTNIGDYNQITAAKSIIIGNGVLTGRYVYIGDNNHGKSDINTLHQRPIDRELCIKGGIVIGDNVWIGDKASILSGVSIGEGSVIGCNAVVTHDIPPYSIVGGIPAKIISRKE